MKRTQALPLLLTALVAGALVNASGQSAGSAPPARISDISLRVNSKSTSLVIEVSEPVPYVATRPDPVTVILEFRNTTAKGAVHSVAKSVRESIAAVYVEPADSLGAPVSRVRIALAQPLAHHVRSERNKVIVDLDKPVPGQALPSTVAREAGDRSDCRARSRRFRAERRRAAGAIAGRGAGHRGASRASACAAGGRHGCGADHERDSFQPPPRRVRPRRFPRPRDYRCLDSADCKRSPRPRSLLVAARDGPAERAAVLRPSRQPRFSRGGSARGASHVCGD